MCACWIFIFLKSQLQFAAEAILHICKYPANSQIPLRIESHYDWEFQSHSHHGNLDHPKGRYRSQGEPHRPPVLAQGLCPTGAPSSRLHGLNVYQAGFFGMTRADKFWDCSYLILECLRYNSSTREILGGLDLTCSMPLTEKTYQEN